MRIDKSYWDDVRRMDFLIRGTKPLMVNRYWREEGHAHPSRARETQFRTAIYHIPGLGCHGYPLTAIHKEVRESVKRTSTTVAQIDKYMHLAGHHGYAVLTGKPRWPEKGETALCMAIYSKWTATFCAFWVRSYFSIDQVHRMIQTVGYGGIGDHVDSDHGKFEVERATVDLAEEWTYPKFLESVHA